MEFFHRHLAILNTMISNGYWNLKHPYFSGDENRNEPACLLYLK